MQTCHGVLPIISAFILIFLDINVWLLFSMKEKTTNLS